MSSGLQIELTSETNNSPHGIYTTHTEVDNSRNKIEIKVSNNSIMEIYTDNKIKTTNVIPLNNEEYSIGNEEKRWSLIIGSQMFNDTAQSKTVSIHSGR